MIDDYERVGIVARTAHTTIWKGFDPALHRSVALKQVRGEHAVAAVHREAAALAKLRHPNIVAVHDLFDDADSVWLVEQWITGAPLSAVLRHTGRLRAIDALALLHGALTGLSHAHQHNLVHGDITPTNILIDQTGTPMLVDFGLAITPGQPSLGATPDTPHPKPPPAPAPTNAPTSTAAASSSPNSSPAQGFSHNQTPWPPPMPKPAPPPP